MPIFCMDQISLTTKTMLKKKTSQIGKTVLKTKIKGNSEGPVLQLRLFQCSLKHLYVLEHRVLQFDTLRNDQKEKIQKALAGRQNDIAIIDEVDSLVIDDNSKMARLAATIAGIDQLQPIYILLWEKLMAGKLLEIDRHDARSNPLNWRTSKKPLLSKLQGRRTQQQCQKQKRTSYTSTSSKISISSMRQFLIW